MIIWIIIVLLATMVGVLVYKSSVFEKEMELNKKEISHILQIVQMNDTYSTSAIRDLNDFLIKLNKLDSDKHEGFAAAINEINFRLDNLQLYDIGDKVDKDWIVTSVDLVSHPKLQYNYSATNIKTGETKTWVE